MRWPSLFASAVVAGVVGVLSSSAPTVVALTSHYRRPVKQSNKASTPLSGDGLFYDQQRQDHFDHQNTVTWKQRYFVNSTFFDAGKREGPICVGGEGPPLDDSVVSSSVHCNDAVELADKLNALVVALEHRYYGVSIPGVADFSTASLRFLSAEQALADLVQFIAWLTQTVQLTRPGNVWVSFGGSYPGMLSSWLRLQYPNSVVAAVASSAPVKAQVNFQGYDDVVGSALANKLVGGSSECLNVVTVGHVLVGDRLSSALGRAELASLFGLCDAGAALADANNQADWAGNGVIYVPAQENDSACDLPACNIDKICQLLLSNDADTEMDGDVPVELQRLAKVAAVQRGANLLNKRADDDDNDDCIVIDHKSQVVAPLLNTTLDGGVARIWQYQTCSEFAFYQTCDIDSQCPFTRGLNTVDKQLALCQLAYGIGAAAVQASVDVANAAWGANRPDGDHILYINGDVDPWHALSVLPPAFKKSEPVYMVPGASHHFWTHPSLPTDSVEVVKGREFIWQTVTAWIQEETTRAIKMRIH